MCPSREAPESGSHEHLDGGGLELPTCWLDSSVVLSSWGFRLVMMSVQGMTGLGFPQAFPTCHALDLSSFIFVVVRWASCSGGEVLVSVDRSQVCDWVTGHLDRYMCVE